MLNRRLFTAGLLISAGSTTVRAAPSAKPPDRGDFPNVVLTNQHGRTVRFYDDLIRGDRTVVINFVFAQCGDICPMTLTNLARVQALLDDRLGRSVWFASISIDPIRDSPAVLKGYARQFGARRGWQFLTGEPDDIERIRLMLGAYDRDPEIDRDRSQHTGMMVYGNQARGRWARVSGLADPREIVARVTRWT
jgi:protein SCO1/2